MARFKTLVSDGIISGAMAHWRFQSFGGQTFPVETLSPYIVNIADDSFVYPAHEILLAGRFGNTFGAEIIIGGDGGGWNVDAGFTASSAWHILPEISAFAGGGTNTLTVLGEYQGVSLAVLHGSQDVYRTSNSTTFSAITNVAPTSHGLSALALSRYVFPGRILAGVHGTGVTTSRIATSDNGGSSWSLRTVPAAWNASHIFHIIPTHSGQTVLATGSLLGSILRSTDNGTTWSSVTLPSEFSSSFFSWDTYQVAWNSVWNQFLLLDGSLQMAVSPDGLNWTVIPGAAAATYADIIEPTGVDRGRLLAANGPVFCLAANTKGLSGDLFVRGALWTVNAGRRWNFSAFGNPVNGSSYHLRGIKPWRDGFAVWNQYGVFLSGSVKFAMPTYDFGNVQVGQPRSELFYNF
jgi:hypothetical protein